MSFPDVRDRFSISSYERPFERVYQFIQETNLPINDLYVAEDRLAIALGVKSFDPSAPPDGFTPNIMLLQRKDIVLLQKYVDLKEYMQLDTHGTPFVLLIRYNSRDYSR